MERENIAALDPGRDKCGFAVLSGAGEILLRRVIETAHLEDEITKARQEPGFSRLILGNGTTSKTAEARLTALGVAVTVVDEYRTTEMARVEYFKANPPRGLRRLIPRGMLVPPCPVDDYVAIILARRYLAGSDR